MFTINSKTFGLLTRTCSYPLSIINQKAVNRRASKLSVSLSSLTLPSKYRLSPQSNIFKYSKPFVDVYIVPMFTDNYGYIIIDKPSRKVLTVDPADAPSIIDALREISRTEDIPAREIDYILCTHKHNDHIGGNIPLKEKFPMLKIIGARYEPIPLLDQSVGEDSTFKIGGLMIHVLHTPCHTKGHIAFVMLDADDEKKPGLLFPGDTLFIGGCGRFFEGSAADMLHNMDRFSKLHPDTAIFCGHEYTESNYKFLISVDQALCSHRYEEVLHMRSKPNPEPTVPSTIGQELATNLFMRCNDKKLQIAFGASGDAVKTMALLRGRKNVFKGLT